MIRTYRDNHLSNRVQFLLFAFLILLIGSSTVAYGQQFFTSFEGDAPNFGDFTLFPSPNSVTFTGGFTQTQGNRSLYHSGDKSFMVTQSNTATISFETPAASVTLWLIDQSNTSVLRVFDQNNQEIGTFNATTSFVQVNVSPECGKFVGSMTLQNNGTGMAVIDDFSFTAGQAQSGESTTLIANFMNGNTDLFKSRVYLWNPSANPGDVSVRVFTLEPTGLSTLLGTVELGSLGVKASRNIKLAEDILGPLPGVTTPYLANGGNLNLEFTITAADVRGAAQVFDNSVTLGFGTYPLQKIPPTLCPSSTVLLANFMNGNTDLFKSRVYLWNPSTSPGNVSVRVFTLGPTGASTLLGTVELGNLEPESALNVKLAEAILDSLPGVTTPYTADDGDLILEFTIGAAGVRGTAQVFDNSVSVAFGTYPLQEIPSTPGASSTVLVANIMNGNTSFLKSRVYLWNPSTSPGDVSVRVFTLEPTGFSTLLGMADLGSLEPESALNVKLAEDILDPLSGVTTPYLANGGNLTLEFTITAADVRGAAQVFDNSLTLAFGVYPLQEVPPTPGPSPTVLLANFMNGNTDFFKSRVYLWNPSASAGDVSVRVYTLEPTGSSTLLGTVELGSLGPESALNVKLAEDILGSLPGIPTPYLANGGNLTLEFTITTADVRGAAQVFADSFAFGTYPLQDPPGPGAGESASTLNPGPGTDPGADPGPDPLDEEGY